MVNFDPNAAAAPDSGVFGLPFTPEQSEVVLLPIPFEATTSYGGGTADGPAAILAASRQVDLFDVETGRPYERGIAMLEPLPELRALNDEARALAEPILAAGGAGEDPALLAKLQAFRKQQNETVKAAVLPELVDPNFG